MKKIFALALALLCVMTCLVACKGNDDDAAATTTAATTTTATTAAETPVLKMATNAYFQPYEFYKDGKIVGIDAEIAAAVAPLDISSIPGNPYYDESSPLLSADSVLRADCLLHKATCFTSTWR